MKYMTPGKSEYYTVKTNAIFLSRGNKLKHELSKCVGAMQLHRYGDVFFTEQIQKAIDYLVEQMEGQPENPTDFLTEAVPVEQPDRRIDLVNKDNDDWYEFETDPKIKKKDSITIYI